MDIGFVSDTGKITQIYKAGTFIWTLPAFALNISEGLKSLLKFIENKQGETLGGTLDVVAGDGENDLYVPVVEGGTIIMYGLAELPASAYGGPSTEWE
ncbi:MAG: hypothetical protein J6T08_08995 [Lentisphaeria bacterium]|nr:hypothetical protein [Lentisphaeria bacterium]